MSNLNSIKKALESVSRKEAQLGTFRQLIRNVEGREGKKALFSGDVNVWDSTGNTKVNLSNTILEMLLSKNAVIENAELCIAKLEVEIGDLNALLDAFGKVMEPILKEQEQC